MVRRGLDHATVVSGAVALVNAQGAEALSLAELAARFRVRTPSLYNHIDGLEGLRRDLTLEALVGLRSALAIAATGVTRKRALQDLGAAYRAYALANPGLYAFLVRTTEGSDDEIQQVARDLMQIMLSVLRGYDLPEDETIHAARAVRATLHGFVALEIGQGFGLPEDVARSFDALVDMLDRGLSTWGKQTQG